jgi:hypothetical protein
MSKFPLGLVYFSGIFIPKRCGDIQRFGILPILSDPLKYILQKYSTMIESFNLAKNTLVWRDLWGYPAIIPSKSGQVNNLPEIFWDTK